MALVLRKSSHIANGIASCGGAIKLDPDGIIPYTTPVNSLFDKVLKFERGLLLIPRSMAFFANVF